MLSALQRYSQYISNPKQFGRDLVRSVYRSGGYGVAYANYQLKLLYYAINDHVESGLPVDECLTAIRHGFKPRYYYLLGLDSRFRDPDLYVSREKPAYVGTGVKGPFRTANQNARHVLQDKVAIYSVFNSIADHFPELYGTIHDGVYHSRDDGASNSLIDAVNTYGTIVAKPVDAERGRGFYKISTADEEFLINGDSATEQDLEKFQRDLGYSNYMVTEFIVQHEYSDRIFAETTNTIRVLTIRDPETGEPQVLRPGHRFGTEQSIPVDNFENGGVIAPIDTESGELGQLVVLDDDGKRKRRDTHPDSSIEIAGVTVPNWEDAKDVILEGAQSYPMARVIGWDIVMTPEKPIILEASGQPGNITPQLERGLLEDPTAKKVLK